MRVRSARLLRSLGFSCLVLVATWTFFSPPRYFYAQRSTATLSGTVTDPSQAAIPSAEITLESTTQQFNRVTVTNDIGQYVITAIPPGMYKLVIKASGFADEALTNITLSSGQASTLNASLKVGKAAEQITVSEAPPLLQSATATVGTVVDSKQLTELPMLGRNFTSMILIAPGVAPVPPPDSVNLSVGGLSLNPSVYGQRQRDNNFSLDGVGNNEPLFNGIPMFPPPEAINEMKIESGMSSGASGHASGANVNLVTKSGGKEYHGDIWESLRNNALDARSFFLPTLGAFKWNQFGGAAGGPLVIPGLIKKEHGWYVFGYYEGIRIRRANNSIHLVPTPEQINGDFSGLPQIYNPYTTTTGANGQLIRDPFPNNRIPANLLNRAAITMAKEFYPTPNLAPGVIPGRNYINTAGARQDGNQWSARVDHQFGVSDNSFFRYTDAYNPSTSEGLPALGTRDHKRLTNLAASHTHIFNPGFLITGRFGMQRINWNVFNTRDFTDLVKTLGTGSVFPPFQGNKPIPIFPPVSIPGYTGLSVSPQIYGPQLALSWTADVQKIVGRHTLEFGGGVTRSQFITNNLSGTSMAFTALQTADLTAPTGTTGSPLASFMLGVPETASRLFGDSTGNMSGNGYSLYTQDNLRASSKLTLNLGLRWDYASPMINKIGSGTFVYETGQYVWDRTNPITNAAATIPLGSLVPDRNNFQPRVGLAYELTPKTVVRASYGIFFDTFGNNYGQTQQGNRGNWPFAFPQSAPGLNRTVPTAFLENPFPGPAQGSSTPLGCQQCLNVWKDTSRTPYVQQWTLSIQRQLTPTWMVEGVYFGSHGLKLSGQIIDNTAVTPGPGSFKDRQLRPEFPPYVLNGMNIFPSYYNALSLKIEKRFSTGLTFLGSYTWSKNLNVLDSFVNGGLGGQPFANPTRFNARANKGPAGYDVPHRVAISYVYELPVKPKSKVANAIVGNWALAGVVTFDNGLPFYPLLTTDNENIGTVGGRNTQTPNLVGDPEAISQKTPQQWFNTAAFAVPPAFTIGNAGRNILRADGFENVDFSLFKRWPFQESRHVELRAEFFNFFNHTNFGYPGALLGTPQFGQVSSTRNPGRQAQIGLKIRF